MQHLPKHPSNHVYLDAWACLNGRTVCMSRDFLRLGPPCAPRSAERTRLNASPPACDGAAGSDDPVSRRSLISDLRSQISGRAIPWGRQGGPPCARLGRVRVMNVVRFLPTRRRPGAHNTQRTRRHAHAHAHAHTHTPTGTAGHVSHLRWFGVASANTNLPMGFPSCLVALLACAATALLGCIYCSGSVLQVAVPLPTSAPAAGGAAGARAIARGSHAGEERHVHGPRGRRLRRMHVGAWGGRSTTRLDPCRGSAALGLGETEAL